MVEEGFKLIPSKGTRLSMMIVLEFLAIVWAVYNSVGAVPADAIAIFNAWSEFTKWNVGIYTASETVIKGAETRINR